MSLSVKLILQKVNGYCKVTRNVTLLIYVVRIL